MFWIYVPTVMAALVVLLMTYDLLVGQSTITTIPFAFLGTLIFLDHYLALSHPEKIVVDDQSIDFSCFGRHHSYSFSQIHRINIRKTAFSKSIYVRINNAGLLKGRYWLQPEQMSDGEELQKVLESLVELKHPMMKNFEQRSFTKTKKN